MSVDANWARDVSFPFRFTEDCNLELDEDEAVVEQALNLISFIPKGTIILFSVMGSALEISVFDQLDEETELLIDTSMREAFEELEPRVFLDKEFVFDQSPDEQKIIVIVPYHIKVTGRLTANRFTIARPTEG